MLDRVGQLVGQQVLAVGHFGGILAGGKVDVAAGGEGVGVDGPGRLACVGVGMDADVAEILAEARLHEAPRPVVKGMTIPGGITWSAVRPTAFAPEASAAWAWTWRASSAEPDIVAACSPADIAASAWHLVQVPPQAHVR